MEERPRVALFCMPHQQHLSALQAYSTNLGHALLDPAEERELGLRARAGDPEAQDALVQSHLAYAVHVAKRFLGRGLDLEELVAIANLGLIQAARRFDPDRANFRTVARIWMSSALRRGIAHWRCQVSMPKAMATAQVMLDHRADELERALGRAPDHDEMAAALRISPHLLKHALACRGEMVRIGPADPDSDSSPADPPSDAPGALEKLLAGEREHVLSAAVASLPERQAMIVQHYFGLGRFRAVSLEEIGVVVNLTRERVRQLLREAIGTLRTGPYADQLAELWDVPAARS